MLKFSTIHITKSKFIMNHEDISSNFKSDGQKYLFLQNHRILELKGNSENINGTLSLYPEVHGSPDNLTEINEIILPGSHSDQNPSLFISNLLQSSSHVLIDIRLDNTNT